MDLTRDFINKIEEMAAPHQIDHEGKIFVDKSMSRLPMDKTVSKMLETETLSSIVDYIENGVDSEILSNRGSLIIHVNSPESVVLTQVLNADMERNRLMEATPYLQKFQFGSFVDVESFIINLQSCFVQDDNTAKLLGFVSSVKDDTSVSQRDDGITQTVTAKMGVSLSQNVNVPNPITLRPYRTFSEIEQPASSFVFRLRKDERTGVTAALFEADGARWKHDAVIGIRDYFKAFTESHDVIILA